MSGGKFIVFEGIDGCGKSTQLKLLATALKARGRQVCMTAEPTDSPTGHALRAALSGKDPRTPYEMAALFTLDRIGHNQCPDGIADRLAGGYDVLCDRYYYSSLAYQGSLCDYEWVKHMNTACPEIRHPDLCVFLDLPPAESLARVAKRGEAREIYEKEETLRLFRDTFFRVFRSLCDRVAIVDAAGTPEAVAERVFAAVKEIL